MSIALADTDEYARVAREKIPLESVFHAALHCARAFVWPDMRRVIIQPAAAKAQRAHLFVS